MHPRDAKEGELRSKGAAQTCLNYIGVAIMSTLCNLGAPNAWAILSQFRE